MNSTVESKIAGSVVCNHYAIDPDFLHLLQEAGLIQLVEDDRGPMLNEQELGEVEKLIRLNQDLALDVDALIVVQHLLHKLEEARRTIQTLEMQLQNRH